MTKVLIVGATGSLARYVIDTLKEKDNVELTLFARNTQGLNALCETCNLHKGDALNYNDVKSAVSGQDIVYINLAGNLDVMATNIVRAMQETVVTRVIAISSIGIYNTPLLPVLKPYKALADIIEASGLSYTILRPDWFTNGNEISYTLTHKGEPETGTAISRKSIAAFVATLVQNPALHVNENLGISKPGE